MEQFFLLTVLHLSWALLHEIPAIAIELAICPSEVILFRPLNHICVQALDASGLKKEAINSVEIVGSSSRVPALLQLMREVFDKEPSRTLNAKECVSRGCALNCAMLSPIFRHALLCNPAFSGPPYQK